MTTVTENPTKNTLTMKELLSDHMKFREGTVPDNIDDLIVWTDGYRNPDGSKRRFYDINGIFNQDTGNSIDFPSHFKARETVEWEFCYNEAVMRSKKMMEETGMSVRQVIEIPVAVTLKNLLDGAERAQDIEKFLVNNLPMATVMMWAIYDARIELANGSVPTQDSDVPTIFGNSADPVFSDVYGVGGRILASELWDLIVEAHAKGNAERVANQKARKPQSKASKRRAESEARRQDNRKKNGRK